MKRRQGERHWPSPEERFWANVEKTESCWIWKGRSVVRSYGKIMVNGRRMLAHRFSWQLHSNRSASGLCVCHRCDNPKCVRPSHLFLGTIKDNVSDMEAKGRGRKVSGEAKYNAKLTDRIVTEMRAAAAAGQSISHLARLHGVSWSTASCAVSGATWKRVERRMSR